MKVSVTTTSGIKTETTINGTEATIGRSVKCDVVVGDESLSRQHCKIEIQAGNFFVTDLGSANGVYIDGNRIEPNLRTAFSSYNQLSLGSLDCMVEESDQNISPTQSSLHSKSFEDNDDSKTVVRKRPVMEQPKKPLPKKEIIKPKASSLGMILPLLVFFGAVAYFVTKEEEPIATVIEATKAPTPAYKKKPAVKTPNEFKAAPDYTEISSKKSCKDMEEFCRSLKIDETQHEGIIKEPGEYIVYLNPAYKLTEEKYSRIKDHQDALDLVAIETLITSDFFNEYLLQKVDQIQLVINDTAGKPLRVYRFHPQLYPPNIISRVSILTELGKSYSEGNPQTFWDLLKDKVPRKDL